jgi:hypothetical protein
MTFVTEGLNGFTLDFLMKHDGVQRDPNFPGGPYTNIFAVNLIARDNPLLCKYIAAIDSSLMIYKRRWGDLWRSDSLHLGRRIAPGGYKYQIFPREP